MKAYRRNSGFIPEVKCYNFYLEKDESGISPDGTLRIQRPSLTDSTEIASPVRGVIGNPLNSTLVSVGAENLYIDSTLVASGITGDNIVSLVTTKFYTAICNGDQVWLYPPGGPLATVAMPDGRAVVDIEQLDSYIILFCPDGRFYWLLPGESAVDPLNFATAESSADGGIAVRRVGDEFWLFGSDSIEPWQPTGDADLPFERSSGRIMAKGCLDRHTVRRFDNTLFWVGDDSNVYRGGGVPAVVSTPAISERIGNRVGEMSAWTFGREGHDFYVLRIPGQGSFVYDASTQEWAQWGTDGYDTWRAYVGYDADGAIYAGSLDSGDIWTVDDGPEVFERVVTGTVPIAGKPPRNDSLTVGVGASEDCLVRIRYRDGQDDYPVGYYDELEVRAPYDLCTLYRLGQPQPPYREVEVSFVTSAKVRVAGCLANEGWA